MAVSKVVPFADQISNKNCLKLNLVDEKFIISGVGITSSISLYHEYHDLTVRISPTW